MPGEYMPSDLELVDRVKQRFLDRSSRRLIPFNVHEVSELARKISEAALDFLEGKIPPGSTLGANLRPNALCASETVTLRTVRGEDVEFLVEVRVGRSEGRNKSTRGYFNQESNTIVIFLSPWLEANDLNQTRKYDIMNENQSILIHEVTHALDTNKYKLQGDTPYYYYNNPHELRAFTRQIVDEGGRSLKGLRLTSRTTKKPMPKGAELIEAILDRSKTWNKIKEHLNDSSQKYIRQVLVNELDLVV